VSIINLFTWILPNYTDESVYCVFLLNVPQIRFIIVIAVTKSIGPVIWIIKVNGFDERRVRTLIDWNLSMFKILCYKFDAN
jgi:hypothetical protein